MVCECRGWRLTRLGRQADAKSDNDRNNRESKPAAAIESTAEGGNVTLHWYPSNVEMTEVRRYFELLNVVSGETKFLSRLARPPHYSKKKKNFSFLKNSFDREILIARDPPLTRGKKEKCLPPASARGRHIRFPVLS
jgi:hypothetical protein